MSKKQVEKTEATSPTLREKFTFKVWWHEGMKSPVKFFSGMTLIVVALVAGIYLPKHISYTVTKSLDHRLFYLHDSWESIAQGEYIMFDHTTPWTEKNPNAPTLLIKQIGCAPGSNLSISEEREFFCDGVLLGKALSHDSAGKEVEQFDFNGIIPANKYFVKGQHERSYDSKYYGFIDGADVVKKVTPLI